MKTHLAKENGNKKLFPLPFATIVEIQWHNIHNEKNK
jgi:hypothetical protein